MSRFSPDPPEVDPLEKQLQTLRPCSCGLDRDRLMFVAGQQSVASADSIVTAKQLKFWRYSTVFSMATSLCLGVAFVGTTYRPLPGKTAELASGSTTELPSVTRSVPENEGSEPPQPQRELTTPAPVTAASVSSEDSYFQLRREWLADPESVNKEFPSSREIASVRPDAADDSPISLQSFRRGAESVQDNPSRPVRKNSLIDSIFGDTL